MTDPHLKGGGQVRYVSSLARELTAMGHEVTIGCKPGSVLVDHAAAAGCAVHDRFAFRGGARLHAWLHDLRAAAAFIRERRPHVIHVSGSQDHWVCALANRILGRPVCLVRTRHNTYPVHDGLSNRVLNRRWTTYQIVVCESVRQTLAKQRAFDAARMCAIHNGVDGGRPPDPALRTAARAEFGFAEEDIVCGIAARMTAAKGHTYLIQALAQLRERLPALRLLCLGQGGLEEALRREAEALGVADRVIFAGFRDDMERCVQAFDIGVQPSIDCDTSSFSLKEQMAAGLPVIASDHGGLPEIVTDGVEGYVVPAGTVAPLAEAIAALAADPAKRRTMGAAGRARVLREFTVEVFARRTVDAYRRALDIHHAGRAGNASVSAQSPEHSP